MRARARGGGTSRLRGRGGIRQAGRRPVRRGRRRRSLHVAAAEQHDMRQQREELVQPDAVAPAGPQRSHPLVAGDDGVVVRAAEQREHRQVALAVTGVRGRVDQDHPVGRPHHVAAPQIAVQPGRDGRRRRSRPLGTAPRRSRWRRGSKHRAAAPRGRPSVPAARRRRSRPSDGVRRSDIGNGCDSGPKNPGPSQPSGPAPNAAAPASCVTASRPPNTCAALGARSHRIKSPQRQAGRVDGNDLRARHAAVDTRKPSQPCGFASEEAGRRARVAA